jgi:hypothetical protein
MKFDSVELWLWRTAVCLLVCMVLVQALLTVPKVRDWLVIVNKIEGVRP